MWECLWFGVGVVVNEYVVGMWGGKSLINNVTAGVDRDVDLDGVGTG